MLEENSLRVLELAGPFLDNDSAMLMLLLSHGLESPSYSVVLEHDFQRNLLCAIPLMLQYGIHATPLGNDY